MKTEGIKIKGKNEDAIIIQKVLAYLRSDHPLEFLPVSKNIKQIVIIGDDTRSDNQINPKTQTYTLHSGLLHGYKNVKEHVASLLIHEAHHVYQ